MKVSFKRLTNEIFNCTTDFLLWQIGLLGASIGKSKTARGGYKAICEANEFLSRINHETVRNAWRKLKRLGFIEIIKEEGFYKPIVTSLGKKRLATIIPEYQEKRPWDKKIYIITYDVPEKYSRARDLLRENIKRLGGASLQKSVWICPYNIKGILDELVKERKIEGTIIVSNTGKDGAIGDHSLEELIIEIYQLESLNERYKEFITMAEEKKKSDEELTTYYLSILIDDPQPPFELLPYWWRGDEAYKKYSKLISGKVG